MKKIILISICTIVLFSGCAHEFNQVFKSQDNDYKYEYAKECFANGKYQRAITLLDQLVIPMKGTENAQDCLYMLGMAQFLAKDYEMASATFRKYCQ